MKIVCMIPARLNSSRFHRKILAPLKDKTLLGNVIDAAKTVPLFDEVYVACCSEEVAEVAKEHKVRAFLTDPDLPNGTMRILSAIEENGIEADIVVNWQGDEPFINETMISELLSNTEKGDIWTLKKEISYEKAENPDVVKVVAGKDGSALYFSRSRIPYQRSEKAKYYKHVGLYAFRLSALRQIKSLKAQPLEVTESLEQLRWLESGLKLQVAETKQDVVGVDSESDLKAAQDFSN